MLINSKSFLLVSLSGLILGGLIALYFLVSTGFIEQSNYYTLLIFCILCGIATAHLLKLLSQYLDSKIPWNEFFGLRYILGTVIWFLSFYFGAMTLTYIHSHKIIADHNFVSHLKMGDNIKLGILLLTLALVANIIYMAFYSYSQYSKQSLQSLQSERKKIDLQFNALKSQLSPHFLFNNLNTISSLIHKDEEQAETFIRKMAEAYNYTLNSYRTNLVSLKEELDFVESSMHLLKTRFKNIGELVIDLDQKHLDTKVPSLTIQMLVENAIKHNVSTESEPVIIRIYAEGNNIIVSNNITTAPENIRSTKVGLNNIIERYRLLGVDNIDIVKDKIFSVKLPQLI